jgi:hypothetical protein
MRGLLHSAFARLTAPRLATQGGAGSELPPAEPAAPAAPAAEVTELARAWARAHELDAQLARAWEHAHTLDAALAERGAELARAWEHAHTLDAALREQVARHAGADFDGDSLVVYNKDVAFLRDEAFMTAYRAGMFSGHKLGRGSDDLRLEWRAHVACWAARRGCALPGDFVECGVNTGILSLAVCHYTDFNATGKQFFLFDTYCGIPAAQMTPDERPARVAESAAVYDECYARAARNFAPFPRARLVRGTVPETLTTVSIERVAYLSIDMNIVYPEVAALEHFWPRLVSGAAVLLDDYGWKNYAAQKAAHDRFAAEKGVPILLLPTGQGLIIKP